MLVSPSLILLWNIWIAFPKHRTFRSWQEKLEKIKYIHKVILWRLVLWKFIIFLHFHLYIKLLGLFSLKENLSTLLQFHPQISRIYSYPCMVYSNFFSFYPVPCPTSSVFPPSSWSKSFAKKYKRTIICWIN